MKTILLSAADVRTAIGRMVADYSRLVGPDVVATKPLTLTVPANVAHAADVLAVDLGALVEALAVEHGWRRWRVNLR